MFQFLKKFLNTANTKSEIIYTRMITGKYVGNIIIFFCIKTDFMKLLIRGFSFTFFSS